MSGRNVHKFQEGVGEKIAMFVWMCSCFVTSVISALCHGWELTLVTLTSMPVSVVYSGTVYKYKGGSY